MARVPRLITFGVALQAVRYPFKLAISCSNPSDALTTGTVVLGALRHLGKVEKPLLCQESS